MLCSFVCLLLSGLHLHNMQEAVLFMRHTEYPEWFSCIIVCVFGSTAQRALVRYTGAYQFKLER